MASPTNTPQTSGPSTSSPRDPSKPHRIVSCIRCQQRKIKCDRLFPCAHCRRTAVPCVAGTAASVHPRRRPNHALKERLARCEQFLTKFETDALGNPAKLLPGSPVLASPSLGAALPISQWANTKGKLIEEADGKVSFMDNALLGSIHEELRAMRDIICVDETEDLSPAESSMSYDNSDLLLGGDTLHVSQEELWPDAGCVFRLWQTYIDRIHPLTKIIHVPTFQSFVVEATNGLQNIPGNMVALLFAVFLAAVVSLSDDECESLLAAAKDVLLQRFSSRVRRALRRLEFLKAHDVVTVQALVLYLISLQGRYDRHAAWVLNGVAIRIAQKMGLHRDGESLGLSPFESEMRRRLWWQIIGLDAKYAILSGLGHSLVPRDWDAREPGNFNDADLYPSATEPFQDRDGPTEMIFCLVQYKISNFLVKTPGLEPTKMMNELAGLRQSGVTTTATAEQIAYYRSSLEDLEQSLKDLLETRCNPSIGRMHEMARGLVLHMIEKKRELFKTAAAFNPEGGGEEVGNDNDNTFRVAIVLLEHHAYFYISSQDTVFHWFALLHIQLEVVLYVAGQLLYRTDGQLVQRAWDQIGIVYRFHPNLLDVSKKDFWTLAQFVLRAWSKRRERLDYLGHPSGAPDYIQKLRDRMGDDVPMEPVAPIANPPMASGIRVPDDSIDSRTVEPGIIEGIPFNTRHETYTGPAGMNWDFWQEVVAAAGHPGEPQPPVGFLGFGAGPLMNW